MTVAISVVGPRGIVSECYILCIHISVFSSIFGPTFLPALYQSSDSVISLRRINMDQLRSLLNFVSARDTQIHQKPDKEAGHSMF